MALYLDLPWSSRSDFSAALIKSRFVHGYHFSEGSGFMDSSSELFQCQMLAKMYVMLLQSSSRISKPKLEESEHRFLLAQTKRDCGVMDENLMRTAQSSRLPRQDQPADSPPPR